MEYLLKSVQSLYFRYLAKKYRHQGQYNCATKNLLLRARELTPTAQVTMDLLTLERDYGKIAGGSELVFSKSDFGTLSHRQRFLYLNFLLEAGQDKALTSLIDQQRLLQLSTQSPPIADYCIRQGWAVFDDVVLLAFLHSQQKQWRQEFIDWLGSNNHDVAVVGNAATILQSSSGEVIDQHNIVVRFNNFPDLDRHHHSTGKNLDVWVHSPDFDPVVKGKTAKIPWIIITGPDIRYMLSNWQSCLPFLRQGSRVLTIPLADWGGLVNTLEAPPSAGILVVGWLNKLIPKSDKSVSMFGFQHQADRNDRSHVQKANKTSARHNWRAESRLIEQWDKQTGLTTHQEPNNVLISDRNSYTAGIFSAGLKKRIQLLQALNVQQVLWRPKDWHEKPDIVLGWGRKKNTHRARKYADKHLLPYIALEDGFLHSVGKDGLSGGDGVSVVVDKTGIYYDATCPSDLEMLIQSAYANQAVYLERAKDCIQVILRNNLTKYNAASVTLSDLNLPPGKKVLVVDQTKGDMSLKYGLVNDDTFKEMLNAALEEHPEAYVVVKTHVRVSAGNKKSGCLSKLPSHPRLILVDENVNPIELIKTMSHVYVASSQMGFEALMVGKPVTCFGVPFYAQWGVTDDRGVPIERRQRHVSVEELFAAAYILYTLYIHPNTGKRCELEDILQIFTEKSL